MSLTLYEELPAAVSKFNKRDLYFYAIFFMPADDEETHYTLLLDLSCVV